MRRWGGEREREKEKGRSRRSMGMLWRRILGILRGRGLLLRCRRGIDIVGICTEYRKRMNGRVALGGVWMA